MAERRRRRRGRHLRRRACGAMAAVWILWGLVLVCVLALAFALGWFWPQLTGFLGTPAPTLAVTAAPTPAAAEDAYVPADTSEPAPEVTPTPVPTPEPTPVPTPDPTPTPPPEVTIAAVGDVMIHEKQLDEKHRGEDPYDFSCWFAHVEESISSADLAIANLETTIADVGSTYTGYPQFRSPAGIVSSLGNAGFDVLTTANNHSLDGGWKGVESTIRAIRDAGLEQTGTWLSQEEHDDPLVVDREGFRIGILAYSYTDRMPYEYGLKVLERDQIVKDIAACREKGAEIIVAMVHWGTEYEDEPSDNARDLAQFMWEQGIDLVLGSHPHVLQTMDRQTVTRVDGSVRECAVIYSMGNFISNQKTFPRDVGLIFRATFSRDAQGTPRLGLIEYVPTWVNLVKETSTSRHYEILPVGVALANPDIVTAYNDKAAERLRKAWDNTLELMEGELYGIPAVK